MEQATIKPIRFAELKQYNDSNSIVLCAITMRADEIPELDKFLHETGLLPETKKVSGVCHLSDNVLGEDGRSDLLVELEGDGEVNPMVRIKMCMMGMSVKWTSDFIDNYKNDYISGSGFGD